MRISKLFLIVTLFIPIYLVSLSSHSIAESVKLGYVDAQRIISESKKGKEASQRLSELEQSKRQELDAKRNMIQKLEEELRNQIYTLSEEAKREKQDKIDNLRVELKRMAEDADRELAKLEKELLQKIDTEVMEIIRVMGKEEDFTFIFGLVPSVVLYASETVDITDEVIKRYNKQYK